MPVKISGDFEIDFDNRIGRGGMGAVYVGRQISVDRKVAIKILKRELGSNTEFVKRFQREAALLARVADSHVVQVFGAGEVDGELFYAMEFVEGEDLAGQLASGHKFSIQEVLQIGLRVAKALEAAWRHQIVHRDIKPSNIITTKDGLIKVMDFGLAKISESDLTQTEVIMGTAKYMSPEQAMGEVCDIRSDLYSFGAVLYELVAGAPPFAGESAAAILYQHVHKLPESPRRLNPELQEDFESVILRLLSKSPDARYETPDEVVRAIWGIMEGVKTEEKTLLYETTIRRTVPPTGAVPELPSEPTAIVDPDSSPPKQETPKLEELTPISNSRAGIIAALIVVLIIIGAGGYYVYTEVRVPPVPDGNGGTTADIPPTPQPEPEPPDPNPEPEPPPEPDPPPPDPEEVKRLAEEAKRLAAEKARKEREAKAAELVDLGNAAADEETALRHYQNALLLHGLPATERRIKAISYRMAARRADGFEAKGDWERAAVEWNRALVHADMSMKKAMAGRPAFCRTFGKATRAQSQKDWASARELFLELAENPIAYGDRITAALSRIEVELGKMAVANNKKLRGAFDAAMARVRLAYDRADWVGVKKALVDLSDPRFSALPRAEAIRLTSVVDQALGAPEGMVYVPAGKFRMGGGREVEGPQGEAETGPFYIDVEEVRVAAYGEFLKALGDSGHHKGCSKVEPLVKKHEPDGWNRQAAGDAVSGVDWWDAVSYAAWKGGRLPGEREWERAAGSTVTAKRIYPWGNEFGTGKGTSFFGCRGMGSGVFEWTADWFQRYPWSKANHHDFGQKRRVLRGGVLIAEDAKESAKTAYRHWYFPDYRSRWVGFRCAGDIGQE